MNNDNTIQGIMKPYLLRYQTKDEGLHRVYYSDSKTLATLKSLPRLADYRQYTLFNGYDASDEGLLKFAQDFKVWNSQLINNPHLSIHYEKYFCHTDAVILTFKRLCFGLFEDHQDISAQENEWWNDCHNGGLMFCEPQKSNSFGYDFSSYYPRILADPKFEIPCSCGLEYHLLELPTINKLQCGIYRVKITSNNNDFRKIFAYSKNNAYTHYSLKTALEHQDQFKINIELIIDDKPNAYIYEDITSGDKIFAKWFEVLYAIKQDHPKNKLIKHLMSSLWGTLSSSKIIRKTDQQIKDEKLDVGLDNDSHYKIINHVVFEDREFYELQNNRNPYKYNIRLKPFITSYGRYLMSNVALENIDAVIRIQTDGIVFNQNMDHITTKYPNIVAEEKTTGMINWINVNKYEKLFH
eukprot:gene12579-16867_t